MAGDNKPKKGDDKGAESKNPKGFYPRTERDAEKIINMAAGQNFENIDQVNQFFDKMMDPSKPLPDLKPQTALEKAQDIAYDAMGAATRKDAISLAREALKISPDCADAFVILAQEYATTLREAIHYYQAGVAAGERAIGPERFKKHSGDFWWIIETRPYMRARAGLAECLWEIGKQKEAVNHLQEMLKLNPNDNQGLRYNLAAHLAEIGDSDSLNTLLGKYKEVTAPWLFTKVLLTFKEQGDSPEARRHLDIAVKHNPHVIPYLTGRKILPKQMPENVTLGEKNEAMYYVDQFWQGWVRTKGSLYWLNSIYPQKSEKSASKPEVKGIPQVFIKAFEPEKKMTEVRGKNETIYTLKVGIKYSPGIWRKIEIRGSQTLHHLHKVLIKAFERDDDHLYAFFMNNRAWDDSEEYGPPYGETDAKDSGKAKIGLLGLQVKSKFLYIFDFGDCWEHPITVLDIREEVSKVKYPRIIEVKGEAPPQYPYDEEE